ncbi:MAG: Polysulfide reductase, NrfD [Fibrobacteres bacterium]|nr:Polysulfide reductase, NrfD [Fibrobacterota bacterium]
MKAEDIPGRPPLVAGSLSYSDVTDTIASRVLRRGSPLGWWAGLGASFLLLMVLLFAIAWLFLRGTGIWGINIPVAWGFAIVNFVWWIGIGHAGTFISAILLLMKQEWRTSINRFAEAMTLFAVACAGMFPLLHLGRPWVFYFMLPYPDTMNLWPQFRSPLVWDIFAVSTYFTVSLLFWYLGLIPDFATLRDRARSRGARVTFGLLSLGWRGSVRHWHRYQRIYLILAALATPLVVSVHSIVSMDFSVAIVPGWHSTIFPPYFVAGAIYSGFAMVLTLAIPLRRAYRLEAIITARHLDNMAKMLLVTGWILFFGYMSDIFMSWYSADRFDAYTTWTRMTGHYRTAFWSMLLINIGSVQLLWFPRLRTSPLFLFLISLVINVGMWLERFVIIITSLHRDYLPSSWGLYRPTLWDWATLTGSMGLFLFLFFLFIRLFPVASISEIKKLVHESGREG